MSTTRRRSSAGLVFACLLASAPLLALAAPATPAVSFKNVWGKQDKRAVEKRLLPFAQDGNPLKPSPVSWKPAGVTRARSVDADFEVDDESDPSFDHTSIKRAGSFAFHERALIMAADLTSSVQKRQAAAESSTAPARAVNPKLRPAAASSTAQATSSTLAPKTSSTAALTSSTIRSSSSTSPPSSSSSSSSSAAAASGSLSAANLASAACLPANSTQVQINQLFAQGGPNKKVVLCPNTVYKLTDAILFLNSGQELSTMGYPADNSRAVLQVTGPDQSVAVWMQCDLCTGTALRNVQVDGARPALGRLEVGLSLVQLQSLADS